MCVSNLTSNEPVANEQWKQQMTKDNGAIHIAHRHQLTDSFPA